MKKTSSVWQVLTLGALGLPVLYQLYAWPALPARVPSHFDAAGQVNGYTSRGNLWLLTLALPWGMALLLTVLPRLDPKRRLDPDSLNFQKLRLTVVGLLSALACCLLYGALHPGSLSGRALLVLLGLFFAFLGNYLTTVPPNYFVGIRTPWTLESPAVWARTHRLGGILFCVSGLLMAGLALALPLAWLNAMLLVLVLGTAEFCYVYSFLLFRREERQAAAS